MDTKHGVLAEESLVVTATPVHFEEIHSTLDRFWGRVDVELSSPPGQTWRLQFSTAIGEIAANIARHAYAIGAAGTMRLRLRLYPDRVEARFTDRGVAFHSPSELLEALSADTAQLPESGFGLSIASAAVDDLRYSRTPAGTNSWRLVKRFPA